MDIAWVGSVPNIFFNIFCVYSYLLGPSFTLLFIFGRVGFLTIHLLALLNIVWLLGGLLLFLDLLQTSERGRAFVRHHHGHGGGGGVERPETPPPSYAYLESIGEISPPQRTERMTSRRDRAGESPSPVQ